MTRDAVKRRKFLLVDGAVLEMKAEFGSDAASIHRLRQAAGRDDVVLDIAKHQKSVSTALDITHRDFACDEEAGEEKSKKRPHV